jgi:hypothetical protein
MVICGYKDYKIYKLNGEIILKIDNDRGFRIDKLPIQYGNFVTLILVGIEMKLVLYDLSIGDAQAIRESEKINILVFKNEEWKGLFQSLLSK